MPAGLKARPPLSLTVHLLLSHCLGRKLAASVWKFLLLSSLGLGLPQSGDKAMTLQTSSGLEASGRKGGLNLALSS